VSEVPASGYPRYETGIAWRYACDECGAVFYWIDDNEKSTGAKDANCPSGCAAVVWTVAEPVDLVARFL
jgi:hypothetical protein